MRYKEKVLRKEINILQVPNTNIVRAVDKIKSLDEIIIVSL